MRAAAAGASILIVNDQPSGFDRLADVVLSSTIGEVLPAIVGADCL